MLTPRSLGRFAVCSIFAWLITLALLLPRAALAAFGYTDNGTSYVVDTSAGLVFEVRKTDGTITSVKFDGTEYAGPSGKGSHIASGLGTLTTVTPESDGSTYVKIALHTDSSSSVVSDLTHYLIVRNGENRIYMATYATAEPDVGELRWITRLDHVLLPNGPTPSNLNDNTGAIESSDVFGMADGTTRSKYYGDNATHGKDRAMDLTYDGATGTNVGVWMIFGSRESSSGGPFFRDIQNQAGTDQEIYNYMNSGHNQTESNRLGVLHGPYALVFTHGEAPVYPLDFSWMGNLGLTGWVSASGRGTVAGLATGIPSGFQGVVGLANASAQYWAVLAADGTYTCSGVKPGDYTATLYKGEFAVASAAVTVTAGATTTLDLASTEAAPAVIFRIGEWDGTPAGLLNGDKIVTMHPQDVRMSPWGPVTFNASTDSATTFPAIQFRGANSPTVIRFTLASNQVTDLTLRIGLTCAYNSGRPQVTVNSWTSSAPSASSQPSSRSFTIGTYRGNNALFTFTVPASALVVGTNTLSINPISGSTDLGTWLSAGWVYDAVELDGPVATPTITYVGGSPLQVRGTAEPGRTITVTVDGTTTVGTATVGVDGTWSLDVATPLAAGSHSFTAVASDSGGHTSPVSAAFTINTGITEPAITAATGDTGTYASGATTSDRVFTFIGTAGPGDTVTLTRIGTGALGTVTADAGGNWSFDYTGVSLPDGANSFYATATNASGTSASSGWFTLNLAGAPRVAIVRQDPTTQTVTAGIGSVVFRVTFNTSVSGVTPAAFSLTATATASAHVASVSAASGTVFDVTVDTLAGTGSLRLDLRSGSGIVDGDGNPEAGYTAGQSYTLVLPTTGNGVWTQAATGGRWSDPRNWREAVIADGTSASADFSTLNLTATNTVELDTPRTVASLAFGDTDTTSAAGWVIDPSGNAGNTLTLAGSTPTITVSALGTGATTTIAAPLAGTAGLTKAGAGTLVLAAANTLTGAVNINAGVLRLNPGSTLANGNNAVNTALNTQLYVAGGTFITTGQVSAVTSSVLIESGTANVASFRTNSDFSGTLRVTGGTLTVGDVNIRRNAGSSADFGSGFIVAGTGVATAGTIGLGTQNSYGCMSVEGSGSLTATGMVTIGNQATGGRGGAMRVLNTATFVSTESTYGVVLCRTNGSNANNAGTATFTGGTSTVEKFSLGYDATVTAGTATLAINGGTLYLGAGGIVKNGTSGLTTALNFSSGILGAKADWSTTVPINLPSSGNITLLAADAAGQPHAITLSGVVSGAGAFTKTGTGVLTLDGAVTHTYTGATTVNAGTLRVTSTLATATNGVVVNTGGTLAGNGTINRPITLNSGAVLAPSGASAIATLTGTALTWNGGATLAFDLGASGTSDSLALSGALTKGSGSGCAFAFAPGSGFAVGATYTLATFASTTFIAADFSATGLPADTGAVFVVNATSLQVRIQGVPAITSANSATAVYGTPFSYTITASDTPATFAASGLPASLTLDSATGVVSGTPTAAGTYSVTLTATNTAGSSSAVLTLVVAKASATVSIGGLSATYTGSPHPVTVTTSPAGLNVVVTYDGSATAPTAAGSYGVVATIAEANYAGAASGTLVIAKAAQTITFPNPGPKTYGTAPLALAATASSGLSLTYAVNSGPALLSGNVVTLTGVGTVVLRASQAGNTNYLAAEDVTVTFTVSVASTTLTLGNLTQAYDGTPKSVTVTTDPTGVTVTVTYNGSATVPTLPGTYNVVATTNDPNYTGTTSGTLTITITALVQHAPVMNGDIDGSVQMLTGEGVTLNSSAMISGDLLVPGTPSVVLNGHPTLGGIQNAAGAATPSGYSVTLNSGAVVRYVIRRVDPIALPTATAPQAPTGTRSVTLNSSRDSVGDPTTLRDLTINGNLGTVALPPGAYRNLTANSGGFILGVAGATEASVYDVQQLTLNGSATLQIVGPVILHLANSLSFSSQVGDASGANALIIELATGGLTINGNGVLYGTVIAPNGTITLNGTAHGRVVANRLTINGNGALIEAP